MIKFTPDHIKLSLTITGLSLSDSPTDQLSAEDLRILRRTEAKRATAFLRSSQNKDVCNQCLLDYAIQTLINMTLPDDADDEDRYQQDRIVTAYLVQEAIDSHVFLDSAEAGTPAQPGQTQH